MNIQFFGHTLSNGLRIIIHQDKSTPMVALNLLYNVGARDENPEKTGFAHLFEHLMFGGSVNIPAFDTPLQKAGGENNAFTTNDITNYYIVLPKENIETAFWLESDRMLDLAFSAQSLEVQRKVVIEEFHQRYLNQPYGDISLLFRPLCYKVHPYQWSTIGKDISHISSATQNDVREFYTKHYNPANAILTICGNVDENEMFNLAEKWFGSISKQHTYTRNIKPEPEQRESRRLEVSRDVPHHNLLISFPMCNRLHPDYHTWDMLSDLLSHGSSSRLNQKLVREQQLFSGIDAYITGSIDEGQFIFRGEILHGISVEQAEKGIWDEIERLKTEEISDNEMKKLINQIETSNVFNNIGILNKAMNLAYFELLGDAGQFNLEVNKYRQITSDALQTLAARFLIPNRSSTLIYKSENQDI
jgi:zinc protease